MVYMDCTDIELKQYQSELLQLERFREVMHGEKMAWLNQMHLKRINREIDRRKKLKDFN